MSDYELVLKELCTLCAELFDTSHVFLGNDLNAPIYALITPPNAISYLYFILETSRRFRVVLSNDMIENCTKWSLKDLADKLLECS